MKRVDKKRLDDLEKKINEEKSLRKRQVSKKSDKKTRKNMIRDKKIFKRWFNKYKQDNKDNPNITLDFESLWNKYKTTILDNPWIVWKPQITADGRSPQTEFLMLDNLEVFYGGAGGGGKTVAILAGALQYVTKPKYIALLLRRTYSDLSLPKSLMDLSHIWLDGTDAKWNVSTHTWTFPSGARVVFGYCQNEGDEHRYQSAEFQYIGVDELTEWFEVQYTFLFSRLRRPTEMTIPIRMRSAANPGGIGHEWVKQRFVAKTKDDDDRVFIPAKLCDNPKLDQQMYTKCLMNLNPIRREQILNGDWNINPHGRMFQRGWFGLVDDYPRGGKVVRYWDKAATEPKRGKDPDWTVGVKATMVDGVFYVIDVKRFRGTPQLNESTIKQTAQMDGKSVDIYMEQEPGSAGVADIDNFARRVLLGYSFRGVKTTGSKEIRANPLSSAAEQGNVKLVKGSWIRDFLDEFELFPCGAHDDIVDATSGAFSKLGQNAPLGGLVVDRLFGNRNIF